MNSILSIRDLRVTFSTDDGNVPAVNGVNLDLNRGENIAIVGESGAGKSQIFYAMMGLLPGNGSATGSVQFAGEAILNLSARRLNKIRGSRIVMVFQDPMTSLNPYLTVGRQLTEVLQVHKYIKKSKARTLAIDMLQRVYMPDAEQCFKRYPHELSGGMRQRVMIAMALLCDAEILIADEPTTALDVSVQTEIISLLNELDDVSIILVTHDLPLVAGLCDRVAVMYAGQIIEQGSSDEIFYHARHPYTRGLLAATPHFCGSSNTLLPSISGQVPNPAELPPGCPFHPRCDFSIDKCNQLYPEWVVDKNRHTCACHLEIKNAAD
ncbi:MAG: ABC transporter ATP-binding protein [Thiothrix sp.]|nr:MAG: ABC transporter ATP-binding protein [Thiothrix sp.]